MPSFSWKATGCAPEAPQRLPAGPERLSLRRADPDHRERSPG